MISDSNSIDTYKTYHVVRPFNSSNDVFFLEELLPNNIDTDTI